jgi:LacI family transcriptional regulator
VNVPVSIREVAALAGVSVATVSNVINRPEIVAAPTRDRVQAAITELGFVRNEQGRLTVILCNSDDQAREENRYLDVLEEHRVHGVLITPVVGASTRPSQELGRTAARLLLEEAGDDDTHRHRQVIFEPELAVRQSTERSHGS